ncbi:MAG: UDP-2,4-diacetamido-2,4,6-trideoxy-beta-L-altropyranose hydrolase, partial [Anaerolineales bacterium]|nr:UDP-2,4-diacetamido-2,4,6-trideoxy-beta-L-altropyranose hydrolase [Anaerolineales bacterium]
MQTLNIRVDAGPQIGTGHLMRCLALAQGWRDSGGSVTFITTCQNNDLLHRIKDQEFNARILKHQYPDPLDWKHTQSMLPDSGNAWIVLDGYHFDEVYQQRIRDAGHPLLVIDDTVHLKHYYADIILNQNLAAEKLSYETEPSTRLLLGTKYALLRKEFLACRRRQTEIPTIGRRLLVSLGGSDSDNHTLKVIHSIQLVDISDLEAIVVIGPSNPHMTELETAIEQSPASIRLIRNANNMPDLMTWADMAISSAGTTTWELLFLGIPSLFLILADNQSPIGKQIQSQKAGKTLGWAKDIPTRRLADS